MSASPVTAPETARKSKLNVLLAEDNSSDGELILRELRRGYEVTASMVQTESEFRKQIHVSPPDIVLAD